MEKTVFILGRDNLSHDLMQNLLLSLTNMKVGCFNPIDAIVGEDL